MGPFNNREIATTAWLLVFAAWALTKVNIRKSLAAILRAFFRLKILVTVCVMALYAAGEVMLLARAGLWDVSLLKDTIVWFCASAMTMMMRFVTSDDTENIFSKVLTDSIKIVIVIEFLVNTYTFSLPAELIIVPGFTLIAALDAVTSSDNQYSVVAKITSGTQTLAGFVIVAVVVTRAISDVHTLNALDTVKSIVLAPFLSLLFSPLLYIMVLISKYEQVFLRLDFGIEKEKRLKRYAKRRILMHAGLSVRKIHHLLTNHAVDLMHIQTEADVDRLVPQKMDP